MTALFYASFCDRHQGPESLWDLKEKNSGTTEVTLEWKKPNVTTREKTSYTVSKMKMYMFKSLDTQGKLVGTGGRKHGRNVVAKLNVQFLPSVVHLAPINWPWISVDEVLLKNDLQFS